MCLRPDFSICIVFLCAFNTLNYSAYLQEWLHYTKQLKIFRNIQVSGDFMSALQDLIPEAIPSQRSYKTVGLILSSYGYGYLKYSTCE
jgi:hypothetical protein